MERQGLPESYIFKIRGPLKYAVNGVVKAEETPCVFLATQKVGEEIIEAWAGMLEENVNIFDPMSSTALTVTRWKREGKTRYEIGFDVNPTPIVTGDNAEERIARILKSAANLDVRFKLPNVL